jgi:Fe-S-cluster-containing hydrogenase component 2
MPWIKQDLCTGCLTCRDECPVEAIVPNDSIVRIEDERCIRCGRCHDVCPAGAVRHDSERIPIEVESNIAWVHQLMSHEYFSNDEKKAALAGRLIRHFGKEMKIAQQTVQRLETMQNRLQHNEAQA